MTDFESKSLAQLHELASDAGIDGFRRLRREDLIEKLDGGSTASSPAGGDSDSSGDSQGRPRRRRSRGGRDRSRNENGGDRESRGGSREPRSKREPRGERSEERTEAEPELTEATGILEVLSRGSGLLKGDGIADAGIYVSPAQIRRCQLRSGDEVNGPVRPARRGERRPSLVRVEKVNGEPPQDERGTAFDGLTPIAPHRHIPLKVENDDVLARSFDLLAPLAFGQRVLVEAQPRSGRTSFLRSLAKSIAAGTEEGTEVTVLLVDERPEEVTAWTREVPNVEIAAAPADLGAHEQVRVAERALAKVKRQAESGLDVVIIVDSLTRLGNAYGDAGSVKPFFGTGRELEEEGAGSVTVIATALWGSPGDQAVMDAVHTTENATIRLDSGLAAAGVKPALDVTSCAISGQEAVLNENEIDAVRRLRAELKDMEPAPAAARLVELIEGSESNEDLLGKL
ncbi:MAG: Rho termination factor N-terminal domain-containing protein [Solirubrobacterales bacterium]